MKNHNKEELNLCHKTAVSVSHLHVVRKGFHGFFIIVR